MTKGGEGPGGRERILSEEMMAENVVQAEGRPSHIESL